MREESAPLYQTRHHHEEEPRMSTGNPASRLQRQTEEPSAIGMALRSIYRYTGCPFYWSALKNDQTLRKFWLLELFEGIYT